MQTFMMIVCALVLFQVLYFLVLFTGELTLWLTRRLGEAYRNNKTQAAAAAQHTTTTVQRASL